MNRDIDALVRAVNAQSPFPMEGLQPELPYEREIALLDGKAARCDLRTPIGILAAEIEFLPAFHGDEAVRIRPSVGIVEPDAGDQVVEALVLYIDRDLAQRRDDVERRTSLDVQVARPHTVDALAGRRCDDLRTGMDHEPQSVARNDPPDGMLRADAVEIHGTGSSIERHGAADMQGAVRLEDLSGERTQTQFEDVAIGRLLVDIVEPFEVDIGLTERRGVFVHPFGIQVHPVRRIEIQLQQVDTGGEQFPQRPSARDADMYEVAERNARQELEAVHGLDRDGIGRSREVLGVEVGGYVAPPIELPIAEDRDAKITGIGGEQSQIMEILLAEDVDGRLRRLDRHVKFVAPFLPRDLQRRTAVEGHLLRRTCVPPLRNLHAPQDALVLRAKVCVIFQTENRHTFVAGIKVKWQKASSPKQSPSIMRLPEPHMMRLRLQ